MSTTLVADLGSASVDESLTEIETLTKNAQSGINGDISVGPFGVLNMGRQRQRQPVGQVQNQRKVLMSAPLLISIHQQLPLKFKNKHSQCQE